MDPGSSGQQFANYDRRLISIFEVLSAYFVDVFYNHVHSSAHSSLKAGASLTDEYVRQIRAYLVGVKVDEASYRQVVLNLHRYFQLTTSYTMLTFAEFEEQIVRQFIPPEYYDLFSMPEKDETLGSVIVDLVSALSAYATSPEMLRRVIDEHDDGSHVTIRMLQDHGIIALLAKRGEIHNSFLQRIGQTKDTAPMGVVGALKGAVKRLVKQKAALRARLAAEEERAEELEEKARRYKGREAKFIKLLRLLQEERRQGQPAAAYSAMVPPRNDLAEVPLPPGPGAEGESPPPQRGRPPLSEAQRLSAAVPGRSGGEGRGPAPRKRYLRAPNLSDFMLGDSSRISEASGSESGGRFSGGSGGSLSEGSGSGSESGSESGEEGGGESGDSGASSATSGDYGGGD
jgi:hypothetical protein